MKPTPFDRFLIILSLLMLILLSAVMIGFASGLLVDPVETFMVNILATTAAKWITAGVALVLIVMAIRGIVAVCPPAEEPQAKTVMIKVTNSGKVQMTLTAVDTLVQKAARTVEGVRDVKSRINVSETQEAIIDLQVMLVPDAVVPSVCENVQNTVKEYVQTHAGLPVQDVAVCVEQVGATGVARVE